MAEQGGHKVGRETRLGFGLVSWSFDYESAATISQRPRPAPSQLTTACATTTTTYWSVLCRQATTQIQLPANLIVLVAEPRKRPGKEERGRGARGSECEQRALAPASNEAWNFSALATVSSFFFAPSCSSWYFWYPCRGYLRFVTQAKTLWSGTYWSLATEYAM